MLIHSCNAEFNYHWYLPKNEMGWVLEARDVWLHETQGNMEVIGIQSEASVHVHLIQTPERVTAAHIYTPSMRHRGHAFVCGQTYAHSDTQYQWQRVSQKTRRLHMDSLDINHWLCDPVMQSPLIPTYDKCTLEWREVYRGGGGGMAEREIWGSWKRGHSLCEQRDLGSAGQKNILWLRVQRGHKSWYWRHPKASQIVLNMFF